MDNKLLNDFISYFEKDKYKFENFCKIFLTWLGFDDVIVTQKSGDKGIDLRCTKKEIDKLDTTEIEYIVQAKCYKHGNNVSGPEIRNFKGTRETLGKRRLFITTSDYTSSAKEEASDPNQPVTLINGEKIIDYCKSLGDQVFDIHFSCNKQKLDDLFVESANDNTVDNKIDEVIKRITKNDVRARILRIPSEYKNDLKGKKKYKLIINGNLKEYFNISSDERYFGGITKYYKTFIQDKDFVDAQSLWKFDKQNEIIYVEIKM
ncbi:MAG: restriction endonuclease [Bacilli bacterium]|nr:restriction endonuclease [Bacilli bacterium]